MSFSEPAENFSKKNFKARRDLFKVFRFPTWQDSGLAVLSSVLLILAFPDFEFWFLAWFALVPLLIAIERNKDSVFRSFWLGLLSGTVFFYGTCWWLTNAPIVYGGLPAPLVYLLLVPATVGAGFFVGIFGAVLSRLLVRFGNYAILLAPFVWSACEWLRLLITGNAWNALGYSQAFAPNLVTFWAQIGGVFLVSFVLVFCSSFLLFVYRQTPHYFWLFSLLFGQLFGASDFFKIESPKVWRENFVILFLLICVIFTISFSASFLLIDPAKAQVSAVIIALQPNVPMSGLRLDDYFALRQRHVDMAESAIGYIETKPELKDLPRTVVFPESPMNFAWAHDSEFREFARDFTVRNRASLLFNSGEPTLDERGYHNSAVFLNSLGERVAQYDKIRLVPFGEFVPEWIPGNEYLPTVVGRMKPGKDFRLMPFGDVRAGVLICYESAFGDLSNEFVRNGADVLVEITNDGYSGNTPILRQHLANAVFRAVETNRPVVRVTNTGITAFINERGEISDATNSYETATRVWTIAKSDGKETFYVRYGDWFAAVCTILSFVFLALTFWLKKQI